MLNKVLAVPLSLTLLYISFSPVLAETKPGVNIPNSAKAANSGSSDKKKQADSALAAGLQLKKGGDTGGALLEFIKAANSNPQLLEAYYQQALIFKEQKLLKLSASRLEQALAIDPEFKKGRVLLATIAIEQGNVGEAINQLGKTLEKPKVEETETIADATILQQIHSGINIPPASPRETSAPKTIEKESTKKQSRWSRRKNRPKKAEKRVSRKKIRAILAKKYKRFHKVYRKPSKAKPWYTRMFAWASPFSNQGKKSRQKMELLAEKSQEKDLLTKEATLNAVPSYEEPQNLVGSAALTESAEIHYTKPQTEKRSKNPREEKALDTLLKAAPMTSSAELVAPALGLEDILSPETSLKAETTEAKKKSEPEVTELKPRAVPKLSYIPGIRMSSQLKEEKPKEKKFEPPVKDKWTQKLTFLNKNGTGSLKRGEAFMFSEDTGEAVLFLADGRRIRRIIAPQQSAEKIVKLRRPDVLIPKELFYDLSLLGKVVANKPDSMQSRKVTRSKSIAQSRPKSSLNPNFLSEDENSKNEPPTFHMEKLMDESRTFVGILRDALRL